MTTCRENERALSNYRAESIIGVLNRNDEDQARRLKCLPAARDEKRRQSCSSNQTLKSMMLRDQGASSSSTISSSSSSTSYKMTESAKLLSTQKAINQTLPKGQKTIKGNYDGNLLLFFHICNLLTMIKAQILKSFKISFSLFFLL